MTASISIAFTSTPRPPRLSHLLGLSSFCCAAYLALSVAGSAAQAAEATTPASATVRAPTPLAVQNPTPLAVQSPLATGGPVTPPAYASGPRDAVEATISTYDLLARLNQPWVQLIDVSSADEYAGRDIRALRGGHIPGARNAALGDNGAAGGGQLIAAAFSPHLASLDRRKETIVYGHQGGDAAPAAHWLKTQGFSHVRVYTDAWETWGNRLELPAAEERFADVAAMRERILELQRTVERLSPRLAGR